MSGRTLLGVAGAVVGSFFGSPQLGWAIGSALGGALFPTKTTLPTVSGPRLNNLDIMSSAYGVVIPLVYGTAKIGTNIIWSQPIKETAHSTTQTQGGGKGGGQQATQTQITYTYSATFAAGVCEGDVVGVGRIWGNGRLIYSAGLLDQSMAGATVEIYTGNEEQLPSAIIESYEGVGNYPAHRGMCYIVIDNLPLDKFFNVMPQITVEVSKRIGSTGVTFGAQEDYRDMSKLDGYGSFWKYDPSTAKLLVGGGSTGRNVFRVSTDFGVTFSEEHVIQDVIDDINFATTTYSIGNLVADDIVNGNAYFAASAEKVDWNLNSVQRTLCIIEYNFVSSTYVVIDVIPDNSGVNSITVIEFDTFTNEWVVWINGGSTQSSEYKGVSLSAMILSQTSTLITPMRIIDGVGTVNTQGSAILKYNNQIFNPVLPTGAPLSIYHNHILNTHIIINNLNEVYSTPDFITYTNIGVGYAISNATKANNDGLNIYFISTAFITIVNLATNAVSTIANSGFAGKIYSMAGVINNVEQNGISRYVGGVWDVNYTNGGSRYSDVSIMEVDSDGIFVDVHYSAPFATYKNSTMMSGRNRIFKSDFATSTVKVYDSSNLQVNPPLVTVLQSSNRVRSATWASVGSTDYILCDRGNVWKTNDNWATNTEIRPYQGFIRYNPIVKNFKDGRCFLVSGMYHSGANNDLIEELGNGTIVEVLNIFTTNIINGTPITSFDDISLFAGEYYILCNEREVFKTTDFINFISVITLPFDNDTNSTETYFNIYSDETNYLFVSKYYVKLSRKYREEIDITDPNALKNIRSSDLSGAGAYNWPNATLPNWGNAVHYYRVPIGVGVSDIYGDGLKQNVTTITLGKSLTTPINVSEIIQDISDKCGMAASDVDINVSEQTWGYVVNGMSDGRRSIEPLSQAFFIEAIEGEKIKFTDRANNTNYISIPNSDVILENNVIVNTERAQELELPRAIRINYIDKDNDYNINSLYSNRINTRSQLEQKLEMPIVMTADQAKQITERILYTAWTERNSRNFKLGLKYGYLEVGDKLAVEETGIIYLCRIVHLAKGADNSIQVTVMDEEIETYTSTATGEITKSISTNILTQIEAANMQFIDTVPLLDSDDDFSYYLAESGITTAWGGGSIYRSLDNSAFTNIISYAINSSIGLLNTAIPITNSTTWDNETILDVSGFFTLASTTDQNTLAGSNTILLGNELISFSNATLVSTDANTGSNTYSISRILRGRRGSDVVSHAAGERVVVVSDANILKIASSSGAVGSLRYFKPVSLNDTIAGVVSEQHTYNANNLRPLSPVHEKLVSVGGDLQISWVRRARINQGWNNNVGLPLDEPTEKYEIEIIDSGSGLVKNFYTSTSQSYTYTAAQQVVDFGTPALVGTIIRIYQISSRVGRGRFVQIVV